MPILPYQSLGTFIRSVGALPLHARNGTVVFDTTNGNYYAFINGKWFLVDFIANPVTILAGQPIGLMGVTYANDVS